MSEPTPVAVASRSFSRHPVLRGELLARYPTARFNETRGTLGGEDLVDLFSGCPKVITSLERLDDALLARLPDLRVISKYGVGLDTLDLAAITRRGIRLGWTGGTNKRSVAELVLAVVIALLRHVPEANLEVRAGTWRQIQGRELSARTVGLIGCGHVGKEVARLMRRLGCRVLAHDIRDYAEFYAETGVEPTPLDDLLGRSEVVSLHVPLDDSTRGILSAERLGLMGRDSLVINMARGGLVDEAALKGMLKEGRLAGAGLDVFADEPPSDPEFLALPNVLATPHIGGSSEEAVLAMGRAAIRGLDDNRIPGPDWPLAEPVTSGA